MAEGEGSILNPGEQSTDFFPRVTNALPRLSRLSPIVPTDFSPGSSPVIPTFSLQNCVSYRKEETTAAPSPRTARDCLIMRSSRTTTTSSQRRSPSYHPSPVLCFHRAITLSLNEEAFHRARSLEPPRVLERGGDCSQSRIEARCSLECTNLRLVRACTQSWGTFQPLAKTLPSVRGLHLVSPRTPTISPLSLSFSSSLRLNGPLACRSGEGTFAMQRENQSRSEHSTGRTGARTLPLWQAFYCGPLFFHKKNNATSGTCPVRL